MKPKSDCGVKAEHEGQRGNTGKSVLPRKIRVGETQRQEAVQGERKEAAEREGQRREARERRMQRRRRLPVAPPSRPTPTPANGRVTPARPKGAALPRAWLSVSRLHRDSLGDAARDLASRSRRLGVYCAPA